MRQLALFMTICAGLGLVAQQFFGMEITWK
jgi:hypothetical protein